MTLVERIFTSCVVVACYQGCSAVELNWVEWPPVPGKYMAVSVQGDTFDNAMAQCSAVGAQPVSEASEVDIESRDFSDLFATYCATTLFCWLGGNSTSEFGICMADFYYEIDGSVHPIPNLCNSVLIFICFGVPLEELTTSLEVTTVPLEGMTSYETSTTDVTSDALSTTEVTSDSPITTLAEVTSSLDTTVGETSTNHASTNELTSDPSTIAADVTTKLTITTEMTSASDTTKERLTSSPTTYPSIAKGPTKGPSDAWTIPSGTSAETETESHRTSQPSETTELMKSDDLSTTVTEETFHSTNPAASVNVSSHEISTTPSLISESSSAVQMDSTAALQGDEPTNTTSSPVLVQSSVSVQTREKTTAQYVYEQSSYVSPNTHVSRLTAIDDVISISQEDSYSQGGVHGQYSTTSTIHGEDTIQVGPDMELSWNTWTPWSMCTTTCAGGQMFRLRLCQGDQLCRYRLVSPRNITISYDIAWSECNTGPCPQHGVWEVWEDWTPCSATCDMGTKRRRRLCQGPKYGGQECEGDVQQTEYCTLGEVCPIKLKEPEPEEAVYKESDRRPSAIGVGVVSLAFVLFELCVVLLFDSVTIMHYCKGTPYVGGASRSQKNSKKTTTQPTKHGQGKQIAQH